MGIRRIEWFGPRVNSYFDFLTPTFLNSNVVFFSLHFRLQKMTETELEFRHSRIELDLDAFQCSAWETF